MGYQSGICWWIQVITYFQ